MRRINLMPYLDGTYVPPKPSAGGRREDGAMMLYPGRWHTCIALTTSGKSWLGLWHAIAEMRRGRRVVYAHFEEHSPAGTLARLRQMAPSFTDAQINNRFIWPDCSTPWGLDEFEIPTKTSLVILDGINAACSQHGWSVEKPDAIGEYRSHFVTPAVKADAAVLSLGHPPKGRDRQTERHGYGNTAWLDEVDGVGFRMEASPKTPIRKGGRGYSKLFSVKDRYGEVERKGQLVEKRESGGWYYLGAFTVDDTGSNTRVGLSVPKDNEQGGDELDDLGKDIVKVLLARNGEFRSARDLQNMLRADGMTFDDKNVKPALERLFRTGYIEWPEVEKERAARPGRLVDTAVGEI